MSNVIDFNKMRIERVTKRIEDNLLEDEDQDKEVEGLAIDIIYDVLDFLGEMDIDVRENQNTIYDIILMVEVVKSLIFRSMHQDYPVQNVAESLMTIEDPQTALDDFLGWQSEISMILYISIS